MHESLSIEEQAIDEEDEDENCPAQEDKPPSLESNVEESELIHQHEMEMMELHEQTYDSGYYVKMILRQQDEDADVVWIYKTHKF